MTFKQTRNVGLFILVATIIFLGIVPFVTLGKIQEATAEILEYVTKLSLAEEITQSFEEARSHFEEFTLMDGEFDLSLSDNPLKKALNNLDKIQALIKDTEQKKDILNKLGEVSSKIKLYRIAILQYIIEVEDDPSGAYAIEMEKKTLEYGAESAKKLSIFRGAILNQIDIARKKILNVFSLGRQVAMLGLIFGVMSGFGTTIFMARALNRPIRQLVEGTQRLAGGNLDARVNIDSRDEIGQLAAGFNRMAEALNKTTVSRDALNAQIEGRKKEQEKLRVINQQLIANDQELKKANVELEEKIAETEKLNKTMLGRELRIIEVKKEVNKLSEEMGRPVPYQLE